MARRYHEIKGLAEFTAKTIVSSEEDWKKFLHTAGHMYKYTFKEQILIHARHLYDVYCMANSQVKEAAFARKELLEKDIAFKQKFYYSKGAHYETATLAEISLIPAEYIMDDVKSDYVAMKNTIYGEYPYFDDIIDCLTKLETEVHALS